MGWLVFIALIGFYIWSVKKCREVTIRYHDEFLKIIEPDGTDVFFCLVPIVNLLVMLDRKNQLDGNRLADKFFNRK